MDHVHRVYVKYLGRTCESDVTRRLVSSADFSANVMAALTQRVATSMEAAAVKLKREALMSASGHSYVDEINDLYISLVERLPSNHELEVALASKSVNTVKAGLIQTSDFRYLERCRTQLPNRSLITPVSDGGVALKYCFAMGTSGISKVSRDMIRALKALPNVFIELEVIQFHNFNDEIDQDLRDAMLVKLERYDYVVVHGMPEFIPVVAKRERERNPHVLIYAIVAWETDRLPFEWLPWLQHADHISCPSSYNTVAFKHMQSLLPPISVVHHPLSLPPTSEDAISGCPVQRLKEKGLFVFYNISEWSNRKGVTELVNAFAKGFKDDHTTILYLKVSGDVSEAEGRAYLGKLNVHNVILDYSRVSDAYIDCIHTCGDCFVSMTKAEGHFIGVCQAHLMGKPVVVTGASGHLDYLDVNDPSCFLIPFKVTSAKYCSKIATKHRGCSIMPHCVHFSGFVPCQMQWFSADEDEAIRLMRAARELPNDRPRKDTQHEFTCDKVGSRLIASILSTRPFLSRAAALAQSISAEFLDRFTWTVDSTPGLNVLVINAGGYGNVGDSLYEHILSLATTRQQRLTFITDNQVVSSHLSVVDCNSPNAWNSLHPFDAIIVGGGGLLNRERLGDNSSLTRYAAWAQRNEVPLYLFSVGFQDMLITESSDLNGTSMAQEFKLLLEAAQYISVRSLLDFSICMSVLDFKDCGKVCYNPDVVYSLLRVDEALSHSVERDTVLVIFSHQNLQFLEAQLNVPPNGKLVFANFAGNAAKSHRQLEHVRKLVQEKYPDADFYHGLQAAANESEGSRLFSIAQMMSILHRCACVYTVRFHGYILARVCQVPTIILGDSNNFKIKADVLDTRDVSLDATVRHAHGGLNRMLDMIGDCVHLSYRKWSNHDRNSTIVRLSRRTCQDVRLLQTMNNRDLQITEIQGTAPTFLLKLH